LERFGEEYFFMKSFKDKQKKKELRQDIERMELRISANMEIMEGKKLMQEGIFDSEELEMD